jgi:hypothetical protein
VRRTALAPSGLSTGFWPQGQSNQSTPRSRIPRVFVLLAFTGALLAWQLSSPSPRPARSRAALPAAAAPAERGKRVALPLIDDNLRGHAWDNGRWARGLARAVRSPKILVVSIQTGSYVAQLTDEASQQLRGRLLAAGLESLSDQFADVEVGATIRLDQADKRPLLDVVELWVGRTGEEQLSSTGVLQLREGLRSELGDGL